MLKRLYVDNFRSLVNFDLRPERVNLIVGKNGAGKSNFCEAMRALSQLASGESPAVVLTPDSLPWWDTRNVQRFEVTYIDEAKAVFDYAIAVRHVVGQPPRIEEESLSVGGRPLLTFTKGMVTLPRLTKPIPFDGRQSILAMGLGLDDAAIGFAKALIQLRTFRLNPWAFEVASAVEAPLLHVDGSNLVSVLRGWSQNDPESFLGWRTAVKAMMPHLEDVKLRELSPGSRALVGTKLRGGREIGLSLLNFSEGERCLLALHAIAGMTANTRVIALDEPDNFLSLNEIQPIFRRFTIDRDDSAESQLFVVTHHPGAIDYLATYATWMFTKNEEGLTRVNRMVFDHSKDFPASEEILEQEAME